MKTNHNAELAPSSAFPLSAVEEYLRQDEESSVDSHSVSLHSQDSIATPPRKQGEEREIVQKPDFTSRIKISVSSLSTKEETPGYVSPAPFLVQRGTPVWMTPPALDRRRDDDTLSLSSDSTLDSDRALEEKALQIRTELRFAELSEIAAVAERAAEAGLDSFAGQPSTFVNDDSRLDLERPLPMQRIHTYSEGDRGTRRAILRRSQTERGRKIPVAALRHIDDLIPPMNQLHLHLRSHLYRTGVETENNLADETVQISMLDQGPFRAVPTKDATFAQKVKKWVSCVSKNGEIRFEEKKSEDGLLIIQGSSDCDFEVGDMLSQHIVSPRILSGDWKPSPVRLPSGLLPPEEHDLEAGFSTPYRGRATTNAYDRNSKTDQPTIETTMTSSSSSENGAEVPERHHVKKGISRDITPVALFNADEHEDDDQSSEGPLEIYSRCSKDHTKPFEVIVQSKEGLSTPKEAPIHHERIGRMETVSPNNLPNLFITPVRLKGIRERRPSASQLRSNYVLEFSRTDSFRSDPGATPDRPRGRNVASDDDDRVTKSESNLAMKGLDAGPKKPFLKPRSKRLRELLNPRRSEWDEMPAQPAGEATAGDKFVSKMASAEKVTESPPPSDSNTRDIVNASKEMSTTPPRTFKALESVKTSDAMGTRETVLDGSPSSLVLNEIRLVEGSQGDSINTPTLQECECLGISKASSFGSLQGQQQGTEESKKKDAANSPKSRVSFRRVMSCPSLAEAWEFADDLRPLSPTFVGRETQKSFLKVFERLSPKSSNAATRNIHFTVEQNHAYLNNYLYCSKPGSKVVDSTARPFCQPCEPTIPCGNDLPQGCEVLSTFSDTAGSIFHRSSSTGDLLTFETGLGVFGRNPQESWFDVASERFDGAIERFIGSARSSHSRWSQYFQAPTLTIKTPQSSLRKRKGSTADKDPKKVEGIILVPHRRSDSSLESGDFVARFGMTPDHFRSLSKEERQALWHERQQPHLVPSMLSPETGSPTRSPRGHRLTLSSSAYDHVMR